MGGHIAGVELKLVVGFSTAKVTSNKFMFRIASNNHIQSNFNPLTFLKGCFCLVWRSRPSFTCSLFYLLAALAVKGSGHIRKLNLCGLQQ